MRSGHGRAPCSSDAPVSGRRGGFGFGTFWRSSSSLHFASLSEEELGAGTFDKLACYVTYVRSGGFMVATADTHFVRTLFSALELPDGVEEPANHGGSVPLVLPRRGRSEAAPVLLVDLPWAALDHFVRGPLPRGAAARAKVLQPSLGDVVGRPSTAETRSMADRWIAEV